MVIRKTVLLFVSISALGFYNLNTIHPPVHAELAGFDAQNVRFLEIASGLNQPLFITNAGDGSGRLFIVQRAGQILIQKNGTLLQTPFLNIQAIVNSSDGEQGLLGLAFHPNYETNSRFYTVHTDQNKSIVLSVFTRSSMNPDQADPNSRVTLLTIPKSYTNHNGGTLAFGPDGYLYWSTGDGGSGGDPDNNAQNLNSLLGKILRLDVSSSASYSIPPGNPFYNNSIPSVRKEIWAYGLRNPWRFSFDRLTGDLYIGDVGQGRREEIDFQPASSSGGENYGWRIMEGSICYNPATGCNQSGKVLPVAEYDHTVGCSVTGGYIYRGSQYPQMSGYYFYGDFCSGMLYASQNNSQDKWIPLLIGDTPYSISSFGEDEQGELYLADYSSGKIYQMAYIRNPGRATLLSPSGAITNTQPTFSWNSVTDNDQGGAATWYYLWVNGPAGNVIKQWYQASSACDATTCSVTSPVTLSGGMYTWWVQTWSDAGGYGPWSAAMTFSLPVPPPPGKASLVSPGGSISTTTPTYTWSEVSGATWYYLWVNNSSGMAVIRTWYTPTQAGCSSGTCSVTPTTTLGSGAHRWWVQTWSDAGGYGPWSDGLTFTVPAPVLPGRTTLSAPNGSITDTTPTYTWSEVSGATWYYLWVNNSSGMPVYKIWYTPTQASCSGGTCSITPTTVLGADTYRWWVQTYNSAGYGPWSDGLNFTIPVP